MIATLIKHSVWPTGIPPVCTASWDQESWDKYADSFRPPLYEGDRFDEIAWAAYVVEAAERERLLVKEFEHRLDGISPLSADVGLNYEEGVLTFEKEKK